MKATRALTEWCFGSHDCQPHPDSSLYNKCGAKANHTDINHQSSFGNLRIILSFTEKIKHEFQRLLQLKHATWRIKTLSFISVPKVIMRSLFKLFWSFYFDSSFFSFIFYKKKTIYKIFNRKLLWILLTTVLSFQYVIVLRQKGLTGVERLIESFTHMSH